MKYSFFLRLTTLFLPLAGCLTQASPDSQSHPLNEKASLFNTMVFYNQADQKPYTLEQWANLYKKPIMVIMWAKWCGPCMRELPSVQKMRIYMKDKLEVLPIAIEAPTPGSSYKIDGITMPLFYSTNISRFMSSLNLNGIPAAILFSPNGQILLKEIGARDWHDSTSLDKLNKILSKLPSLSNSSLNKKAIKKPIFSKRK